MNALSPPSTREWRASASFAQERLWFVERLYPGTPIHNMPVLLSLGGRAHRTLIERCLAALIDRHETLRTDFVRNEAGIEQRIFAKRPIALQFADMRRFPRREREVRATTIMEQECRRPFDLSVAPLLRAMLIRMDDDDDRLLIVLHHIIADASSVEIITREIGELYAAFAAGQPSPLEPLRIQYADWALWQKGKNFEAALDDWRDRLAGSPGETDLPADYPRPAMPSYRGAMAHFRLSDALSEALTGLARDTGCTLYMVLLAAFGVMLGRYCRTDDVVIGSPMTMRSGSGTGDVVGLFVNTLPLRARLDPSIRVRDLLAQLRDTVRHAQSHADLPLERLIERINPVRRPDRHPLFQTLFSLQTGENPSPETGADNAAPTDQAPPGSGTAKFDLSLLMFQDGARRAGAWEYATDLFEPATIDRMTDHFESLLSGFVASPETAIGALPMADEQELAEIETFEPGPKRRATAASADIVSRFDRMAADKPDAPAIGWGATDMSYAALAGRMRHIAAALSRAGLGQGDRIGICMARRPDMIAATLAIMRIGAAYVPLDPALPSDRLAYIATDAGITHALIAEERPAALPKAIVSIDCAADADANANDRSAIDEVPCDSGDAAYVLYTSGSTGRPKGVVVPHRALSAFLDWASEAFDEAERARILASTSLGFDISIFELFLPLTTGGTVVLVEDVLALAEPDAPSVTLINTVPSAMRALLALWQPDSALRAVNLAGEALTADLVWAIRRAAPDVTLRNLYGPTETTIYATAAQIDDVTGRTPSIGRPIMGSYVRILTPDGDRAPIGVPGELYIGGAGLASGYLGQPALTADRYLPDRFAEAPDALVYRTGDLVRWLADGEIGFLGRIDDQVKLRGYRIELGEIETILRAQTGVEEAVVKLVRDGGDAGDGDHLAAFVAGAPIDVEALERGLRSVLPGYMIPATIAHVAEMPRTGSGKIDRAALIEVEARGGASFDRADLPEDVVTICDIFARAVGRGEIGPDANFFEIGGHSLLATRVVAQLNEMFGIELPLSAIFAYPTPVELAAHARTIAAPEFAPEAAIAEAVDESEPAPLSMMQEGMLFFEQLKPGSALYNIPILIPFGTPVDAEAVRRTIEALARRHDALRMRFVTAAGETQQMPDAEIRAAFADRDADALDPAQFARAVEREMQRPFDLRRGPPYRATLFRRDGEDLLAFTLHHIVGDGHSIDILRRDFDHGYAIAAAGGRPDWPTPAGRYADFARWHRARLESAATEAHIDHFRVALAGATMKPSLPTDRPRPVRQGFAGGHVPFRLSQSARNAATRLTREQATTPHNVYLALVALLFARLSGCSDQIVGVPVANRQNARWHDVVGLFTNSVAIRIDGRDARSLRDWIDVAAATAQSAFAHEELPFDLLVKTLAPDRSAGHHPVFQTMFGFREDAGDMPDLADRAMGTATSKFDLAVSLTQSRDGAFGSFEYADDLFDRESVERVADAFVTFGEACLAAPDGDPDALAPFDDALARWCREGLSHARPASVETPDRTGPAKPPASDIESRIAEIWAEVLEHDAFGTDDNFFEVGGHSLAAMVIASRLAEIGHDIPVETMFLCPTIAELAREIEGVGTKSGPRTTLAAADRKTALCLSFAQERLWFLDRLSPGLSTYHIPLTLPFAGPVDAFSLEAALLHLGQRHEILRSRFPGDDEGPALRIDPTLALALETTDLSRVPRSRRGERARRIQSSLTRRPFDLANGPLLRAHLVSLSPREHVLLLVLHHIVADARSIEILRRDLLEIYEAELLGDAPDLAELDVQFADFAAWQRADLRPGKIKTERAFWQDYLSGAPRTIALPSDRPRPAIATDRGRQFRFALGAELTEQVRALAQAERATPYMVMLAAFSAVLGRWSDNDDMVIGTPVIGRPRREFEQLIGFFSNTLPLRLRSKGDPSFRQWIGETRDNVVTALGHQQLPFDMIVQHLMNDRELSHHPLFQVMFAYDRSDSDAPAEEGEDPLWGTAKFDLTLFIVEAQEFACAFEYRTDLFDTDTIARLAALLRDFIAEAVSAPDRTVGELTAAGPAESQRIADFSGNGGQPTDVLSLGALFDRLADAAPDAAGLVCGSATLTYAEIDQRARQLAAALRAKGCRVEDRVAITAQPSADLIVAVLAIWMAGGVCVPLDPGYPRRRLALMVERSGATILVGDAGHRAIAADLPFVDWSRPGRAKPLGDLVPRDPAQLAYIVFTSGSTGEPKGVAMPDRALVNLVDWQAAHSDGVQPRTLQFASPSFDVFFQEVALTLWSGGTLVIAETEDRRDPERVIALCRNQAIERLFLPYVALREIAETGAGAEPLPALREVITAGEKLIVTPAIRRWFDGHPAAALINHYGPSETHVVTEERLGGAPDRWSDLPSIGTPIANVRCEILDRHGRRLPIGMAGELYLGGTCLARGYCDRPELTAERFVPDPHGPQSGDRLYRTGDRARWRDDGRIDFLGRLDEQMKIRGYRIEPAEIEKAIARIDGVRQAVATAAEDSDGNATLIAHVLPESKSAIDDRQLREALREYLPEPLIPSRFLIVDRFAKTPSGKIDRRALPPVSAPIPSPAGSGDIADIVRACWLDILGLDAVDDGDSFFALGGHSLSAVRLAVRLGRELGIACPVRLIFEHPHLAEFAAALADIGPGDDMAAGAIAPVAREGADLAASFAQQRLWFVDAAIDGGSAYNLVHVVNFAGDIDAFAMRDALDLLVARHEALRSIFVERGGRPRLKIAPLAAAALDEFDLSRLPKQKQRAEFGAILEDETYRAFDLALGPLFHASILDLGAAGVAVILTMHHIISDGRSLEVIERDLRALYEALRDGLPADLPALPVGYADYAAWQSDNLTAEENERLLDFWRDYVGTASRQLKLHGGGSLAQGRSASAGRHAIRLEGEALAAMREVAADHGATMFMATFATFAMALQLYVREDRFLVGTPVGARDRAELENMVGLFVNTMVLRAELGGEPDFLTLLDRVRADAIEAFAHSALPFEQLVDDLLPHRAAEASPLAQIAFGLNRDDRQAAPGDAGDRMTSAGNSASKFELSLVLLDSADAINGVFEYRRDLYADELIAGLAGHFETLFAAMAANPALSAADALRPDVLADPVITAEIPIEPGACTPDPETMIAEIAAITPGHIAVEAPDGTFDYRTLDRRANGLAHKLAAKKYPSESRVGVAIGNGKFHPLALLAIQKAGLVYLPLDPALPPGRQRQLAAMAGARCILADRDVTKRFAKIDCWNLRQMRWQAKASPPAVPRHPDQLAYIVYTSGSTGTPKGVMIARRGLSELVAAQRQYFDIAADDRVLKFSTPSFDAAIFEMTLALTAGATLCLEREDRLLPGIGLADLLADRAISVVTIPPSSLALLPRRDLPRLRLLCVAGEACPASLAAQWAPGRRMVNCYGPTECTVWTTAGDCIVDGTPPPIGWPVGSVRHYIVGGDLQPVPKGAPGELCVAGPSLARGYLDRPAVSAAAFVPDPFGAPGACMYRTGDLVRQNADGAIEFIGRIDSQVKIRGARVEPGEVESAISALPEIAVAVVNVEKDGAGANRLIAHAVGVDGHRLDERDVIGKLRKILPRHMLPARLVVLEAMPRMPSGKIDRAALPPPDEEQRRAEELPGGSIANAICTICEELLGVPVGPSDNFFERGGHSLLLVQLMTRIGERLGLELSIRQMFEADTIADLCALIDAPSEAAASVIPRLPRRFTEQAGEIPDQKPDISPNISDDGGISKRIA